LGWRVRWWRWRRYEPSVAASLGGFLSLGTQSRWQQIKQAFTVPRNKSVQIHKLPDPLAKPVCNPGGYHAAIAVAYKDDIGKVFVLKDRSNVADVPIEIDTRAGIFFPLSKTAHRGGE
jgi:hypothetical protein